MERDYVTGKGRQKDRVRARYLFCYLTIVKLGEPVIDLARRFLHYAICYSAIQFNVEKNWLNKRDISLKIELFDYLRSSPYVPHLSQPCLRKTKVTAILTQPLIFFYVM